MSRNEEFVPLSTLLMLAVSANEALYTPFLVIAVAFPRLKVDPTFWLLASLPLAATVLLRWGQLDNHQYLFMYWCLTLYLAYGATRDKAGFIMAANARSLIVLCMAFAVLAKILSHSYLDGSFFTHALLLDTRFADISEKLTGMTPEQLEANQAVAIGLHTSHLDPLTAAGNHLKSTRLIPAIASAITWWTIGIEAFIALTFAMPRKSLIGRSRNAALLIFMLTTYSIAPVTGFAWILMNLGIAQCEETEQKTRITYFAAFVITCMMRVVYNGFLSIFAPF